jgi:hypothetical protein
MPTRLIFQENVVSSFEGHESGSRDFRGKQSAFFERNDAVITCVQYQRWDRNFREELIDIDIGENVIEPHGVLR